MKNFAAEFRDVFSLYIKLGEELSKLLSAGDANNSSALVHSLLENKNCLAQISQMNARIAKLSDDWTQCRPHLKSADREEADRMAAAAKAQALRLQELCLAHIQKLQAFHDGLKAKLVELGKGVRYAKGLKLTQGNYPKFIDSSY
ncbi:MAG TPA: hypothetical protein VMG30_01785 [Acidobacteriota bacterium]|nr:hypothetical protein [Acidobacteriota bacterium]